MTFDPQSAAENSVQPGNFSFMDRLLGRNYPHDDVAVYLDEQAGLERVRAVEEHAANPSMAKETEEKIAELDARLAQSRYVFRIQGFPPEQYDAIVDEAEEQYPIEYEERKNPFSGEVTRIPQYSEEFADLLNAKLWAKSIVKIVAPDGSIDETALDSGTAANMRNNFPIDGRRRIDAVIQELRMGAQWMDDIQDEGFLATP